MTIHGCVYARVSTTPQSVGRQIRELKDIAAKNDWVIVDTYINNGISGSMGRDKRPELNRMIKNSITRKCDVVMVSSINRLGRSLQHLIEIVNDLQSKTIDLFILKQAIDTTTPSGKLMFSMIGAFAEFKRSIIRECILSGLENAKAKGKVLWVERRT